MASIPSLHRNTPDIIVAGVSGPARALCFLRHPGEISGPARILVSRTLMAPASRTVSLYGTRPLMHEGRLVPDATTLTTLSGAALLQHTADGDATLSLSDSMGRPLWHRNAQGTVTTFAYEGPASPGRLLAVHEHPAGGQPRCRETLAYGAHDKTDNNLAGQVTEHHNNAGCTRVRAISLTGQPMASDECLLLSDTRLPDWGADIQPPTAPPLTVSVLHDATGALLRHTNAAGVCTVNTYGISGALRERWLQHTPKAPDAQRGQQDMCIVRDIVYTADGRVMSQTHGNGVKETYEYDRQSQWLSRHTLCRPAGHPQGGLCLSDVYYTYDPMGNILQMEDKGSDPQWHGNGAATGVRNYAYDTLYRLVSASGRERQPASQKRTLPESLTDRTSGNVWKAYTERYTYDDGDNLTQIAHASEGNTWTRLQAISASSNRGCVQTEGRDTLSVPDEAFYPGGLQKRLSDGRQLRWYADNQLQGVSAVKRSDEGDDTESYHYRDGGERVRKVRTVQMKGGVQKTVTTYAGGMERRVVWLGEEGKRQKDVVISESGGVRVIEDLLGGEVHYRYGFGDHLGSIGGETDAVGNITAREEYGPYGGTVGSDEEREEVADRTARYSGKERDATGLYYYGYRYYQAELGRWLSADPGGLIDGANLFRMVRNNPISHVDYQGLVTENEWYAYVAAVTATVIYFGTSFFEARVQRQREERKKNNNQKWIDDNKTKITSFAKSKGDEYNLNENEIKKIDVFFASHFDEHLKNEGISEYKISRNVYKMEDGAIYAYIAPDKTAATKIDEIIKSKTNTPGREIESVGGEFRTIRKATPSASSPDPINLVYPLFENTNQDVVTRTVKTKIKKQEELPPPAPSTSASSTPEMQPINIVNPDKFNGMRGCADNVDSINNAMGKIRAGRRKDFHKLSDGEWSVDLINFNGAKGRGKMRMLFTLDGNKATLTRIANTH